MLNIYIYICKIYKMHIYVNMYKMCIYMYVKYIKLWREGKRTPIYTHIYI